MFSQGFFGNGVVEIQKKNIVNEGRRQRGIDFVEQEAIHVHGPQNLGCVIGRFGMIMTVTLSSAYQYQKPPKYSVFKGQRQAALWWTKSGNENNFYF